VTDCLGFRLTLISRNLSLVQIPGC